MIYAYETTPLPGEDDYVLKHILSSKFVTANNDINEILARTGAIPRKLKWDGKSTLLLMAYDGPYSLGKLVIICCSEEAVEKFEMQVLKNNLKLKNQTPFNNVVKYNIYYNAKEKEKRLLFTKYSAK